MAKTRVFIDTNIIIGAFRTGCWVAICNKFAIETVDKCVCVEGAINDGISSKYKCNALTILIQKDDQDLTGHSQCNHVL